MTGDKSGCGSLHSGEPNAVFTIQSRCRLRGFAADRCRQALLTSAIYQVPMRPCERFQLRIARAIFGAAILLSLGSAPLQAGTGTPENTTAEPGISDVPDAVEPPTLNAEKFPARAAIRAIIERETAITRLPADIADAVAFVESRYDSTVIGGVGEIGVMQVRPETAAMLGFRGTLAELATPEINIHYGVKYLSRAWRLAGGDLCRALMKYRAGHGEEVMSARSRIYCNRARNRLVAMNSALASPEALAAVGPLAEPEPAASAASATAVTSKPKPKAPIRPADVYASFRQGTAAASRAYWAAHEAKIRTIKARIESRWKRVASR
jgi:Transglycosylase SLT domain